MERAKLVVFSPLPPLENGIADYTFEILPLHALDFDVTVVLEDNHPMPVLGEQLQDLRIVFLAEYNAHRQDYDGHIHLYHLGNNPDHVYMLPIAMERPGIIVLHDVSLHYLVDCATLRWGDFSAYMAFLQREYGPIGKLLGEQFEKYRWRERMMFYELPLTRTLLTRAKGVIVHSAFAYFKVKAQCLDKPVALIPHHLTPMAEAADALDRHGTREKLYLDDVELVLLSLGFITKAKQIDAVFRVLAAIRDDLPPFRYVLAGARLPDQFDVDAEIAKYELEDVVTVTDYLDEAAFFEHIAASDLVINLRYPTGGETSGTLIRALGCGACVVVVDHGPFAELPDDVCLKVPWSERFDDDLARELLDILSNTERRQAIGERAKRYMRDRHAIEKSANSYRQFLLETLGQPIQPWGVDQPYRFLNLRAREKLFSEFGRPPVGMLWAREAGVPEFSGGRLVLASNQPESQCVWLNRHGYSNGTIDLVDIPDQAMAMKALPDRTAHAVLFASAEPDLELFIAYLKEFNRVLSFGGLLVIDLVQSHFNGGGLLADPSLLEQTLSQAGFIINHRALGGPSDVSLAVDFKDTDEAAEELFEACWQAIKISEFLALDPKNSEIFENPVKVSCAA